MTQPHPLPGILGEIARLTCYEAAIEIARHWGGVRLHIPRKVGREHRLAHLIGKKPADLLCASHLGGQRHDIPKATAVLNYNDALRLRLDGKGYTEIALKLGLSYVQVARLLDGIEQHEPHRPGMPQAPVDRCPLCGRRRLVPRRPDPRQMALPIEAA
jgi:hypothetical protein